MIVIPTGTDAPIYHWPIATVGMMVLNVALFIIVPPERHYVDPEEDEAASTEVSYFERFSLALGNDLHPVQWVTHNFLHVGIGHLIGNLIFLWAFGMVVEGKLGLFKYVAAYLAIGTLHGALTQTLLLRSGMGGSAVGASAIVFGLLAMCMVWAPRNELNCIAIFTTLLRTFVFHWDLRYTTVAALYVGEQIFNLFWGGLIGRAVVTELGHLSGAFWGCVIAVTMLKLNLVDCEGWDVFTLWVKRRQLAKDWKLRGESLDRQKKSIRKQVKKNVVGEAEERSPEDRAESAVQRVRKLIDMGDFAGAVTSYDKAARTLVRWPSQPELYELIKAMHAQNAESDSLRLMRDHVRYYPEASNKIRLKLAQVLIRDRQRPTAALRLLAEIAPGSLTPDLESARRKLARQATHMQEEGVLELEGDD